MNKVEIMNNTLKLMLTCIIVLISSTLVCAQDYETLLQQRAKERVRLMNDYISYMADKSSSEDNRYFYRKKALPLFIGKGYEYKELGIIKNGVTMQTTSVNRNTIKTDLIREYFSRLVELEYSNVNVTSTQIADIKVSDLKKVDSSEGKTLYMCTCQYVQYFKGEYGDGRLYGDKTTKRIVCYIEVEDTEDGQEYVVLLGDVEAIHTERL